MNYKKMIIFSSGRADYFSLNELVKFLKKKKYKIFFILYAYEDYSITKVPNINYFKIKKKVSDALIFNSIHLNISKIIKIDNEIKNAICFGDRKEALFFSHIIKNYEFTLHHYNGGEITKGSRDNVFRYQISLNADYHYVTNSIYKKNLLEFGIKNKNIFIVGNLAIDFIKNSNLYTKKELQYLKLFSPNKINILFCQHPNTKEHSNNIFEINEVLKFFKKLSGYFDINVIVTYPNNDHGSDIIKKKLLTFSHSNSFFNLQKYLGFKKYMSILKFFNISIGNTSSNLLEAPYFRIPVINIGQRQEGRISFDNIINSTFNNKNLLRDFLKIKKNNFKRKKINVRNLGNGHSAELFYLNYRKINKIS